MYAENQFPKWCSCGASYDKKSWQLLPYAGIASGVMDGERFYADLEMRNCACRSTMAVKLAGGETR